MGCPSPRPMSKGGVSPSASNLTQNVPTIGSDHKPTLRLVFLRTHALTWSVTSRLESLSHSPSESPGQRDRGPCRGEKCVDHRALGGGSASGTLARFELSAQARRRSEDLAPAASTTSKRSAMLTHPSTELVARAPSEHRACCGERMRDPSGPRARASASSAALRSTRRASATFKRGASQLGALERRRRWLFFSRGRLPRTVVNWGSSLGVCPRPLPQRATSMFFSSWRHAARRRRALPRLPAHLPPRRPGRAGRPGAAAPAPHPGQLCAASIRAA